MSQGEVARITPSTAKTSTWITDSVFAVARRMIAKPTMVIQREWRRMEPRRKPRRLLRLCACIWLLLGRVDELEMVLLLRKRRVWRRKD